MEEYILLFNKISDAIEKLEELKQKLISAQQKAEEIFIEKESKKCNWGNTFIVKLKAQGKPYEDFFI